jgi:hypothetical protein
LTPPPLTFIQFQDGFVWQKCFLQRSASPPSKSGLAEFPKNNHRKIKQLSGQAFPPARQPSDPVPKILFPV